MAIHTTETKPGLNPDLSAWQGSHAALRVSSQSLVLLPPLHMSTVQKEEHVAFVSQCPAWNQRSGKYRMNTISSSSLTKGLLLTQASTQTPWLVAWTLVLNAGGVMPQARRQPGHFMKVS